MFNEPITSTVVSERAGGIWLAIVATSLALFVCGCDTPYTKKVRELEQISESGYLSHEDYLRFVHEEEQWDRGNTSSVIWSK